MCFRLFIRIIDLREGKILSASHTQFNLHDEKCEAVEQTIPMLTWTWVLRMSLSSSELGNCGRDSGVQDVCLHLEICGNRETKM